jgi:hypothetical protein
MKKALLIIACVITFTFESHAQQQRLLSYDTLRYNYILENYCLEKGQKVLDSTQADYIKKYMIWAKKNFTWWHKGTFSFIIQSDTLTSDSVRLAGYALVKNEFLKYGLTQKQIKWVIDLNDPKHDYGMWISGCPNKIIVEVIPHIRNRKYRDLIFCDD